MCDLGAVAGRRRGEDRRVVVGLLNANYLLARLTTLGVTEYLSAAYDRTCMHEFVLSGAPMRRRLGISTLDLAKRLLDYGFHPPTIFLPLLVDEAC